MRTKLHFFAIFCIWLAGLRPAEAQGPRFFRISGPAATTNIAFRPDGTLIWSNAQTGTNYRIQGVSTIPGGTNWVNYVQLLVSNNLVTNQLLDFSPPSGMTFIPAGIFTMGDTLDGESDALPVTVNISAFHMETNLVSFSLWQAVYAYATNHGYGFDHAGSGKAANQPVQTLNWYDVVKWSNARSQQAGLTAVYYTDAGLTQAFTNGDIDAVYLNWSANGYRLPTEAEWEKAARGGLIGHRFPWGDTIYESQANYYGCVAGCGFAYDLGPNGDNLIGIIGGSPDTSPIGSFAANGYGLYDMAGNVFEWCWDWYGTPYGQPTTTDPTGVAIGTYRVLRGGSWNSGANGARCADREIDAPSDTGDYFGFRCVRGH